MLFDWLSSLVFLCCYWGLSFFPPFSEHETAQSKYDLEALIHYNLPSGVLRDQKLAAPDIKENGDFNVRYCDYRVPSQSRLIPLKLLKFRSESTPAAKQAMHVPLQMMQ